MTFAPANVADILRCSQRDIEFVNSMEEKLLPVLRHYFGNNYIYKNAMPYLIHVWYYYLTSASNLQTLGEEYANILRTKEYKRLPSRMEHLLWLSLYLGGEPLLSRFLNHLLKITKSHEELKEDAKQKLVHLLTFVKENQHIFLRLHYSLFLLNGVYQNISNRFSNIKYALVRHWLQNESATKSFQILGKISFLYLFIYLCQSYYNLQKNDGNYTIEYIRQSSKICILCSENRKNTSATPCGHLYCWDCIYNSLKYNQKCPVCREQVNPSRIVFLQNYC